MAEHGSIAIVALTQGGRRLAGQLAEQFSKAVVVEVDGSISRTLAILWDRYDNIVCLMACGIVVRAVAPLVTDKRSDPAVVVMDEQGRFAVSLLSGHLGGANELARCLAKSTGGQVVITTASDCLGKTAFDLWLRDNDCATPEPAMVTRACSLLVNHGQVRVFCDTIIAPSTLPDDFLPVSRADEADSIITMRQAGPSGPWKAEIIVHPRRLVLGVGCNRGTRAAEFETALADFVRRHNLAPYAIRALASIDLKADETGLLEFAAAHGWKIFFYTGAELNTVPGVSRSEIVKRATGAAAVAEPAALLAAGVNTLFVRKQKWTNITMAAALSPWSASAPAVSTI